MSRDYDRYVLFVDLSGEEQLFDLGKAKLILAGGGVENGDELVVRTEDDRWVVVHTPSRPVRSSSRRCGPPTPRARSCS